MKRTSAIYSALSLSLLAATVTTLGASSAQAQSDPAAASSGFDGVSVSRNIDDSGHCTYTENATQREYTCTGIPRNFIGSAVVIHFPDKKSFQAVVAMADGSDPGTPLNWTEQGAEILPNVTNQGSITPQETVRLIGETVPRRSTGWDLGLDAGGPIGLPQTVDAIVTITRRI
ncbi:hypothetical protein LQL77_31795 [Rhodococcus cerastii]|nr:hypothetical protein [Rhodococcus cerastii]